MNTLFQGSESTFYETAENWEIFPVKINEFISLKRLKKELRTLRKQSLSGAWCWFSSIMSSCNFYIQSILYIFFRPNYDAASLN